MKVWILVLLITTAERGPEQVRSTAYDRREDCERVAALLAPYARCEPGYRQR